MKLLIMLILSFFASSVQFGQTKIYFQFNEALTLKSYAHAPTISDTIKTEIEIQENPKINGVDIAGQLISSPISGIIFAVLGGLGGYIIEPTSHDGPTLPVAIGALAGYTVGSAIGVYVVARKDKYDPNLGILIGSSILGELTGILLYSLSNANTPNTSIFAFAPLVLPPVFTIVTLNAFQQKKSNIKIGFDVQQLPQPNAYSYGIKLQYLF